MGWQTSAAHAVEPVPVQTSSPLHFKRTGAPLLYCHPQLRLRQYFQLVVVSRTGLRCVQFSFRFREQFRCTGFQFR